jgi:hypothetical protein
MKQVKVDKLILQGEMNGNFVEGEYVAFDIPLTIEGGIIHKAEDDVILIVSETLKKNMYGKDITPKVNLLDNDIFMDNAYNRVSYKELTHRPSNKDEYNALNEFLRKEFAMDGYQDIDKNNLTVYDINEDYKIINHNECIVSKLKNGKEVVSWDIYRYAYKYGFIFPYDITETNDNCVEDISDVV